MPEGGYGELLNRMAKGVKVRYGVDVQAVEYGRSYRDVAKVLAEVNGKELSLACDAVVVTVPLGVLQRPRAQGGISFDPALPAEKIDAMKRLGFGVLNKVSGAASFAV